jgi:RloB-like protein
MGRKRHESSFRRKINIREKRKRFLIVCEGKRTEPYYFRAFPTNKMVVSVSIEGTGHNTVSLVTEALKLRDGGDYDEVWCVFDKNSFSPAQVNQAIALAEANDMQVAFSNEAFELWYLLHFHFYNTGITRQDYCQKLSLLLGYTYKKNRPDMYEILKDKLDDAISNARRLLDSYQPRRAACDNPSTTVHLLVERLKQFSRQ